MLPDRRPTFDRDRTPTLRSAPLCAALFDCMDPDVMNREQLANLLVCLKGE